MLIQKLAFFACWILLSHEHFARSQEVPPEAQQKQKEQPIGNSESLVKEAAEANSAIDTRLNTIDKILALKNVSPLDRFVLEYMKDKLVAAKQDTVAKKKIALETYYSTIEVLNFQRYFKEDSSDTSEEDDLWSSLLTILG